MVMASGPLSHPTNLPPHSSPLSPLRPHLVPQQQQQQSPQSVSTDQTYLMPARPTKSRSRSADGYIPKVIRTLGQKPAVLVSASVTYVGDNNIYAFGGFDQYTDEVYNHVLRLDLDTKQWSLVDNYGDIPGVRMGHTASLWQGNKVIIFGGENEHRSYLSDVIVFDVSTAHWQQPEIHGPIPRGRARHSAVIHDDRLFVLGGLGGIDNNNQILDDFCFLDLNTWTWSKSWRFVPRFDHTSWVWSDRLWVFGGLTEGMEHVSDVWWLDLKQSPHFNNSLAITSAEFRSSSSASSRTATPLGQQSQHQGPPTGYAANSSSVQVTPAHHNSSRRLPMAPGSVSSVQFVHGPRIPSQAVGRHFHAYSSGYLLDFTTPSITGTIESSLCALELENLRWEKLAGGKELYRAAYRWHYCAMDPEGTQVWLLGCPAESTNPAASNNSNEYLSEVMYLDLRKLGLLGNSLTLGSGNSQTQFMPISDTHQQSTLSGIGADLARMFDQPPEVGSSTDFIVTANSVDWDEDEETPNTYPGEHPTAKPSKPIHVHRLILEARWPHFARMIASQMAEFHSKKLHIPEPYPVVRAFLAYLYTDSIAPHPEYGFTLDEVAGMLVMADCYEMNRLRLLCRNRLARELDVEHAATVWDKAGQANEEWLKRKAAKFCMTHWGYVVRSEGFRNLGKSSLLELSQEISLESRIVSGEDYESSRGLSGRYGTSVPPDSQQRRFGSIPTDATSDDESMELS